MPTVVREGVKSRQKGSRTDDFGPGPGPNNSSPDPAKSLGKSTPHNEGVKEARAEQSNGLEHASTTLSKPEKNVDYLSSAGSGLAIVPRGDEHVCTPERVSRELVVVDDETKLQRSDHIDIYEQEQKGKPFLPYKIY